MFKGSPRKIISQEAGFLNFLGPLMTAGLPSMENSLKLWARFFLLSLGLTAAAPEKDATIQKKIYESGMAALIFSNEELNDIFKIVKSLKDPSLLLKGISETTEIEAKKSQDF